MTTLLLFVIAISSFLFYGVVGADKTWLLAPLFILNYGIVAVALLKEAIGSGRWALETKHHHQQITSSPLPITHGLWFIFLIYGIAMIPQASAPFESKLVLLFIGGVLGAYIVWGRELTSFKDNRVVLGVLIFVVMLTAIYGLIVHFKCPERVLWTERYAVYEGRLTSTYICPNHFAHLMQMLLPFCLVFLFIPQAGIYLRILSAYSFLIFLLTLYLTESRAGWLGSIAAVGITVCLMALRRSKKLFILLVVLVPLCSILLFFGAWRYSEVFQRRMQPVVTFLEGQAEEGLGSESRDFRPQTWMDTIDMIKEQPLIGFGPGNYRYTFPEYRNRFKGTRIVTGHPHNEYLELIADYGLIGFGLFTLAWLGGLVLILIRSLKAEEPRHAFIAMAFLGTATGTMVHSFFDFQMHVYPNALVFALLAAMAIGPLLAIRRRGRKRCGAETPASLSSGLGGHVRMQENEKPQTTHKERPGHRESSESESSRSPLLWLNKAFAWVLAIGFLIGTAFCLQSMSSAFIRALGDSAAQQSIGATASARSPKHSAINYYELAAKIDPQNWRAYKGMAELSYQERYYTLDLEEKFQLAEIEKEWYEKAYVHNSHDPEIVKGLGKCLIFLGRTEDASASNALATQQALLSNQHLNPLSNSETERGLELLREACSYRRFNDTYWWTLGVALRNAGLYDEAIEIFQYAGKIKQSPSIKENIQWIDEKRSGVSSPLSSPPEETPDAGRWSLRLKREKEDLTELFDLMGNKF